MLFSSSTPMCDDEDLSLNDSSINGGEDRVTDLPPSSVLQHLGKARPKRPKKHAPSRGAVAASASASANNSNANDTSIDDGVDAFYPASFNSSGFSSPSGSANRFVKFFLMVLLRRTSFLTTFYGLYFSHHHILQIACWASEGSFHVYCVHLLSYDLWALLRLLSPSLVLESCSELRNSFVGLKEVLFLTSLLRPTFTVT